MTFKYKLGIIGYGNMATAIMAGMTNASVVQKSQVLIYDTDAARRAEACNQSFVCADEISRLSCCEYVFLAVKPQNSAEVLQSFGKDFCNSVVISIMAGVSINTISSAAKVAGVCRCMPNTPAVIGKGVTVIDYSHVSEAKRAFIDDMFGSVGTVIHMSEDKMDAVTAVSGSGPAYVYMFIDAYIKAALSAGLDMPDARALVIATVSGACDMVAKRNQDIPTLIESVCSKGGTTIEAVMSLQNSDFYKSIENAVAASKTRSQQLSRAIKK